MAYVDGELEADAMRAVAEAIAADAELAERVAVLERADRVARTAFANELEDDVPPELIAAARRAEHALNQHGADTVPTVDREPPRSWWRWAWPMPTGWSLAGAALAATVVVVAVVTVDREPPSGGTVAGLPATCPAGGVAAMLETRPSGDAQTLGPDCQAAVLATYRLDSRYCRSLEVAADSVYRGLACRTAEGWEIGEMVATVPSDGYAPATAERGLGDLLDAATEARTIADGWR
jgi:hypothetical protein